MPIDSDASEIEPTRISETRPTAAPAIASIAIERLTDQPKPSCSSSA